MGPQLPPPADEQARRAKAARFADTSLKLVQGFAAVELGHTETGRALQNEALEELADGDLFGAIVSWASACAAFVLEADGEASRWAWEATHTRGPNDGGLIDRVDIDAKWALAMNMITACANGDTRQAIDLLDRAGGETGAQAGMLMVRLIAIEGLRKQKERSDGVPEPPVTVYDPDTRMHCPECGSQNVDCYPKARKTHHRHECHDCGHAAEYGT